MTMDLGLSEANCCSLYQALKIIEKKSLLFPILFIDLPIFKHFSNLCPSARELFGALRWSTTRRALSRRHIYWMLWDLWMLWHRQVMSGYDMNHWWRLVSISFVRFILRKLHWNGNTRLHYPCLQRYSLIHFDSELTSRKSSADNAKFFLHPFGFDLRVNASTPGEDFVSCQFCTFFFLPVAIHMSIGWYVRVSHDSYCTIIL